MKVENRQLVARDYRVRGKWREMAFLVLWGDEKFLELAGAGVGRCTTL